MLKIESPRFRPACLIAKLAMMLVLVLSPVLMANATAQKNAHPNIHHDSVQSVAHASDIFETDRGHSHSEMAASSDNSASDSSTECTHVGDNCCSNSCGGAMILSLLDGHGERFADSYSPRALNALLSGQWAVPHRPPNT